MDPQQSPGQFPPADNNPYQFIMEPPKKQRPSNPLGGVGGNPFIMKLIFIAVGALLVLGAATILINVFFAPKTSVDDIVSITQSEQEIIRIATQGQNATSASVKNAAISTRLAVTTQQQYWLSYLAQNKRKMPAQELNLKKNAATDTQLTQAKATSTFDGTFKTTLRSQLEAYNILLKDAADKAVNEKTKAKLLAHYSQVQLLLQQLPQD